MPAPVLREKKFLQAVDEPEAPAALEPVVTAPVETAPLTDLPPMSLGDGNMPLLQQAEAQGTLKAEQQHAAV